MSESHVMQMSMGRADEFGWITELFKVSYILHTRRFQTDFLA